MDIELINKARKEITSTKLQENKLVIKFGYYGRFLFPYKDGLAVLSALANAEAFNDSYDDNKGIGPINTDHVSSHVMSAEQYQLIKMAALLKVSITELQEAIKAS